MKPDLHKFLRRSVAAPLLLLLVAGCDSELPLAPSFDVSKGVAGGAPTNLTASAASYHQIWLAWQDNSTNEDGWEVWRSTTGPTSTFTLFTVYPWPNITAGGNDLLQASTEYCYKVRAYKGARRQVSYSDFSNVACATTLAVLPAAPSGVNAAPRFNGYAIHVTWTDNASNENGFRVERSPTTAGPWTTVGSTSSNATSLDDAQVPSAEQPVCYRVFAVNSFGDSGPSNVACTTVPVGPTNLVAAVLSDGSVDLSWTDVSAVEDGFAVYRWTAVGPVALVATLSANATSYHDSGVGDSTYWYRVYATKDGGTSRGSNTISVVVATKPPAAPANLDAVPQASSIVAVSWLDASANEEGFRVERSADGGASWVSYYTTGPDQAGLWDNGAAPEQQVCYRVIAFNVKGDSPPSNTDCTTPPAGPTGFTATVIDSVTVDFAWTDNSAVEDGYQIAIDYGYGYWEVVATVGPNTTSFRLQGYPYPLYQTYFVVALKDGGYSDRSNAAFSSPPPGSSTLRAGSTPGVSAPRTLAPRRLTGKRGKP